MVFQLVHDADRWFEMTVCARAEAADAVGLARQLAAHRAERVRAFEQLTPR
jgi:hypothetical protein